NTDWEKAEIIIHAVVNNSIEGEQLSNGIKRSLKEARIEATVDILMRKEGRSFPDVLREKSTDADIVFMGLKETKPGKEKEHMETIKRLSKVGKVVVFAENNSMDEAFPILLERAEGEGFGSV
ncbi:MAG: hypothetical protein R3220_02275, partial [Balneolaceae bacterium]|nr:hypothetical protein [Balneolaceae bacterium]